MQFLLAHKWGFWNCLKSPFICHLMKMELSWNLKKRGKITFSMNKTVVGCLFLTEVNYWPYIMWPYMCMILHCYLMLCDLTCIYITWSYIMWPNTLGDLTLRENASWYVECWAKASSDNSPFSEHPNCLNLNHNLSTSAMLTKTKQKIMHAKSVRIKN